MPYPTFPLLVVFATAAVAVASCSIQANHLRCEHVENPIGITVTNPRLSWWASSTSAQTPRNQSQSAYEVIVASTELNAQKGYGDLWNTGRVPVDRGDGGLGIVYAGKPLKELGTRVYWRVKVWDGTGNECGWSEEIGFWELGPLTPADWQDAQWITQFATTQDTDGCGYYADHPTPLFRTEFDLSGVDVASAVLHVAGLGQFLAFIDGTAVGDAAYNGVWSNYGSSVMFSSFDVTSLVSIGNTHALGIELGNGWWNPAPLLMWGTYNIRNALLTGDPMVLALLVVTSSTGKKSYIISDTVHWSVGSGSVLFNNVYLGNRIDNRLDPGSWSTPGYRPSTTWPTPHAVSSTITDKLGELVWHSIPPVKAQRTIVASGPVLPGDGSIVYDAGVNIVGNVNITVSGPAGAVLIARYGEILYPNGSVNAMTSVAGQVKSGNGGPCAPYIAFQEDWFTLSDAGVQSFVPKFTWHGFQYIAFWWTNITAAESVVTPTIHSVIVHQQYIDMERVSSFRSSSDMLNRVFDISLTSQQGNLANSGVQTDCPHRERFGYGGDAAATAEAMMLNFNMAAFVEKRIRDFNADVRSNGGFTETAPFVGIADSGFGDGSGPVGWGWVQPLYLHYALMYYNSTVTIPESYNLTKNWLRLLQQNAVGNILNAGLGDWSAVEPKSLVTTATGFYFKTAKFLAQLALVQGKMEDLAYFESLSEMIATAFTNKYLNQTSGVYSDGSVSGSQCQQSLPLYFNMFPAFLNVSVIDAITTQYHASAARNQNHFVGGMFSMKWWLLMLSSTGAHNIATEAMLQQGYPSFGYMLNNNATSVWEVWQWSDNTYSHNHAMMTSVTEWAMKRVLGLDRDEYFNAWRRAIIHVVPLPGVIDSASGGYTSVKGTYNVSWAVLNQQQMQVNVAVPVDCTALVVLPSQPTESISVTNSVGEWVKASVSVDGVLGIEQRELSLSTNVKGYRNQTVITIGSGSYSFVCNM